MDEINYEKLLEYGDYTLRREGERLKLLALLLNIINGGTQLKGALELIMKIIDFEGELSTDTTGEYFDLIYSLWFMLGGSDCACSSGTHDNMAFLGKWTHYIYNRNKTAVLNAKKEKLKKLRSEIRNIEQEIKP